tara:strand:+ start:1156 stop:1497 length:342 start_codon:yes stop_codon:yes gene_type:complete
LPLKPKADYSNSREWWECQRKYARAQLDFPEGLGLNRTLRIKRLAKRGWLDPLWTFSPSQFKELLNELRCEYHKLKRRLDNGQKIEPDLPGGSYGKTISRDHPGVQKTSKGTV